MPVKTFYIKDATASGSSHGSLQDGGTAPTAATTITGWTVAKTAAGNFSLMIYGTDRASGTFSTTDSLSTQTDAGTTTSWRSENKIDGVFANTAWTITGVFRTPAVASTHSGRLNVKVFKSPNANGTANATVVEITSGKLTGSNTGAMGSTTTDYTSSVTFTPTAPVKMYNEYLFVTMQWETTVAGGSNSAEALFRVGATANVVTSDFTPRNKTAVIT